MINFRNFEIVTFQRWSNSLTIRKSHEGVTQRFYEIFLYLFLVKIFKDLLPDLLRHSASYASSNDSTSFLIASQQPGGSVFGCEQSVLKASFLFSTKALMSSQHMSPTSAAHVFRIQTNRTKINLCIMSNVS